MKPVTLLLLVMVLFPFGGMAQGKSKLKKRFVLPGELLEASGLYISNHDTLWWHNDGGQPPLIYATDLEGRLLDTLRVPGTLNVDWEDITTDTEGNLYLCDFGNNLNDRRDLKVYRWRRGAKESQEITYHYPDQDSFPPALPRQNFDAEGCIWFRDSLYIFSKNRFVVGDFYTKLYRLPSSPGSYSAELLDSLYLKNRVVTAAALSPDSQRVALLTYHARKFLGKWVPSASVFLLSDFNGSDFFGGKVKKVRLFWHFGMGKQYEALDFLDNRTLIIGCEARGKVKAQGFVLKVRK